MPSGSLQFSGWAEGFDRSGTLMLVPVYARAGEAADQALILNYPAEDDGLEPNYGRVAQGHNLRLENIAQGMARGELTVGPNSINPHGNVHGGALATLADTVGGCCACSKGGNCVTANCTLEFLRPATGSKIVCEATPKKMGRTLSVIQVVLTNDQEAVVATGTYTFFMAQ